MTPKLFYYSLKVDILSTNTTNGLEIVVFDVSISVGY